MQQEMMMQTGLSDKPSINHITTIILPTPGFTCRIPMGLAYQALTHTGKNERGLSPTAQGAVKPVKIYTALWLVKVKEKVHHTPLRQ